MTKASRFCKINFIDDGYLPIYSDVYTNQNLSIEVFYYDDTFDWEDDYEEYEELPEIIFPGAQEFEA